MNIAKEYRFTRKDGKVVGVSVTVGRGMDAPQEVGTGSRWTTIQRPRMMSFLAYDGDDLYKMDVPVLFDGYDDNKNLESDITTLNQMRRSPGNHSKPPLIKVEGALPVKSKNFFWVIEDITWGTNVIWTTKGDDAFRIRQDAVVHLLQYSDPDSLSIRPATTSHIHFVKKGETLAGIAKIEYGDPRLAGLLKSYNNIRDVKKLPSKIVIPPVIGK